MKSPRCDETGRGSGLPCTVHLRIAASLVAFVVHIAGAAAVIPLVPGLQVRYFCGHGSPQSDKSCASTASVAHSAAQSLYFAGIFALSIFYGGLADCHGRKWLFLTGIVGRGLPLLCLWALPDTLSVFYAATVLGGLTPAPDSIFFTMIADLVPKWARLQYFGAGSALFMMAFASGTALSSHFQPSIGVDGVLDVSAKTCMLSFLVILLVLPETVPRSGDGTEDDDSQAHTPVLRVRQKSLIQILGDRALVGEQVLLRRVAWIGLLSFMPQDGVITISLFYIKLKLGLDGAASSELGAKMLCVVGLGSMLWQTVGLWALRRVCADNASLYLVFLFVDALHLVGYTVMWSPWTVLANATLAGAPLALPTILRAIVSEALPSTSQGRGSGALSSVAGLSSCCAPLMFGSLFVVGNKTGLPGCPFLVGMVLLLLSSYLASSWIIPKEEDIEAQSKIDSLLS